MPKRSKLLLFLLLIPIWTNLTQFIYPNHLSQTLNENSPGIKSSILGESYPVEYTPELYISGGDYQSVRGGVISFTSVSEPFVRIVSYNLKGEADVTLYKATQDQLLNYLAHDQDNNQINKSVDFSTLEQVAALKHTLSSSYDDTSRLSLPLTGTGIWFLRLKKDTIERTSLVVRSDIGAVVKEGNDELIFWGQDFNTGKSISSGEITVYDLLNAPKIIQQSVFNQDGIAKLSISESADIALVKKGNDLALVPINLNYINLNYDYNNFAPESNQSKYYFFTDRPLYRPGDTIYFKAIVRDDHDAVYTLPTGTVTVKGYQGYGEDNLLFDKKYPISSFGTVDGEYVLAAAAKPDDYYFKISRGEFDDAQVYFKVEHYRKPEYFVDVDVDGTNYIVGDTIKALIKGQRVMIKNIKPM